MFQIAVSLKLRSLQPPTPPRLSPVNPPFLSVFSKLPSLPSHGGAGRRSWTLEVIVHRAAGKATASNISISTTTEWPPQASEWFSAKVL